MLTPDQESKLLQLEGTMTDKELAFRLMAIGINTKRCDDTNTEEAFANLLEVQNKVPVLFSPVFENGYKVRPIRLTDDTRRNMDPEIWTEMWNPIPELWMEIWYQIPEFLADWTEIWTITGPPSVA